MTIIDKALLDEIAELEVQAIKDGLNNPAMRKNPAFLEKVRKFLKENNLKTIPETPGISDIQKITEELPTFPIGERVIN